MSSQRGRLGNVTSHERRSTANKTVDTRQPLQDNAPTVTDAGDTQRRLNGLTLSAKFTSYLLVTECDRAGERDIQPSFQLLLHLGGREVVFRDQKSETSDGR
jgi:hypothetical protein